MYHGFEYSKASAPPAHPGNSIGRVVLYDNWLAGFKGKKITAANVYENRTRSHRKQWNRYWQYVKKISDSSGSSAKKKGTGNKVSIIKKPCIREPPKFNELPQEEQLRLNEDAAGFRDVGYFVIHNIRLPVGTLEEVPNEEAMSSRAASMSMNSVSRNDTLMDTRVEMYESFYLSYDAAKAALDRLTYGRHKQPVVVVTWGQLMTRATWFSEHDTVMTGCLNPLPDMCSHCDKSSVALEACDGAVLVGIGPAAAPCQRSAICADCRPLNSYRGTDSYICPSCLTDPATYKGIYGYVTRMFTQKQLRLMYVRWGLRCLILINERNTILLSGMQASFRRHILIFARTVNTVAQKKWWELSLALPSILRV